MIRNGAMSQPTQRHTNQLLGYPDDARLLIINADDFGMCHAVNAAITRSLTDGVVRSTLMVPCAWALHAMQWLAAPVAEDNSVRAKPRLRRRRLTRPATPEDFPTRMSEGRHDDADFTSSVRGACGNV
jgi:hypothetical protein